MQRIFRIKTHTMYIIINNETGKATTTKQKTIVASIINVHRNTVSNKFKKEGNPFKYNEFTVYEGTFIKDKVSKGNKDTFVERQRKWREKEGY